MTTAESILAALGKRRFQGWSSEVDLHATMAGVFVADGIELVREYVLPTEETRKDRPDFFHLADGIAVEVKIKGTRADALRQLHKYSLSLAVRELVLVTTVPNHMVERPSLMNGKPLRAILIGGFL